MFVCLFVSCDLYPALSQNGIIKLQLELDKSNYAQIYSGDINNYKLFIPPDSVIWALLPIYLENLNILPFYGALKMGYKQHQNDKKL